METAIKKFISWVGTPQSLMIHSAFFVGIFALRFFGVKYEDIMLILTTVVSLEAIYLSIFIQMSVNNQSKVLKKGLQEVKESVEEVQESVEEVQESVEEVQETVEEEQKDNSEIAQR